MNCKCPSCQYINEADRRMETLSEEDRKFFDDMLERLYDVESSHDVLSAILDGSWPNAIEILALSVKKLGYKLVPIDSTG